MQRLYCAGQMMITSPSAITEKLTLTRNGQESEGWEVHRGEVMR